MLLDNAKKGMKAAFPSNKCYVKEKKKAKEKESLLVRPLEF